MFDFISKIAQANLKAKPYEQKPMGVIKKLMSIPENFILMAYVEDEEIVVRLKEKPSTDVIVKEDDIL